MIANISLIFNRKRTASRKVEAPVEVRITYQRKTYYITTGIKCKLGEYRDGKIIKRLDMQGCNDAIAAMLDRLRETLITMDEMDIDKVKMLLAKGTDARPSVSEWMMYRADERVMQKSTRRQHMVALRLFCSCGLFNTWEDITLENLTRFDERLRKSCGTQTTVHSYHKRLKPYIHDACTFGLLESNPYDSFKVARGKSERIRYLTDEERTRLEQFDGGTATVMHVRDLFLFQCYTGLAYADASALTADSFIEVEGEMYIETIRRKCDTDIHIKVIGKARQILERYGYTLPWMSNEKYNLYLKILAAQCGIKKRLTSHMARHTFATTALHYGIPIEVVSKMLAHTNIKTTQIYAKVLAEDVSAGFDILDKL